MKPLENRWFTKTGKAKRIPAKLEQWREWATQHKQDFAQRRTLELVKSLRIAYPQLNLADATNLMVYLVGCYSNATEYGFEHVNGTLFSSNRYAQGEVIAGYLDRIAFDIRKLELVK